MKNIGLVLLLFSVTALLSAQEMLKTNQEMSVKENLRLRTEESTNSSIITTMGVGTKVKIKKIGSPERIDGLSSNWVQIEVLEDAKDKDGQKVQKGAIGWCYGGYLTKIRQTIYDSLDLSEDGYIIREPKFKNDLDKRAWKKLAGFYFVGGPRETITEMDKVDTSWGTDYALGSLGSHSISYDNGKWNASGDGESISYTLVSISDDGNSFTMKPDYGSQLRTWTFNGYSLSGIGYYKYTGPDCYKHFIREFVSKYKGNLVDLPDYNLGNIPIEILKALKDGDIQTFAKYTANNRPIKIIIGDYRERSTFSQDELLIQNQEVMNAFLFIKSDLSEHKNLLSVKPLINQFYYIAKDRFTSLYPDGEVFIEYSLRSEEEISLVFIASDNELKLIGVVDYAVFRR